MVTGTQRHLGDAQHQLACIIWCLMVKLAAQHHIRCQQLHFVIFGQSGLVS